VIVVTVEWKRKDAGYVLFKQHTVLSMHIAKDRARILGDCVVSEKQGG
jgi:hypothetical protein